MKKENNSAARTSRAIFAILPSAPLIVFACEPETGVQHGQTQTGGFVDNSLHGPGTARFPNGDVYEGSFDRGRRAGAGTLRFADGRRYTGAWANDRPEGHGVFTYPNGDRYEGGYRRGIRHGRGVLTTHADARYDGGWVSDREGGRPVGKGSVTTAEGTVLTGSIVGGRFVPGS